VTVSVDFRSRELEYIMRFAGSKIWSAVRSSAISITSLWPKSLAALPVLATYCVVRDAPRRGMVSSTTSSPGRLRVLRRGDGRRRRDADGIYVRHTATPKGVMHSHNTALAAARILNGDLGLAADDVMMIWLPSASIGAISRSLQSGLAGTRRVLLDRFRPQRR